MIDDDDKIRRNLVVASSAVVLMNVLGFKISPDSVTLFGFATASPPSPATFWTCVTLTLFYLFARYRFDHEVSRQFLILNNTLNEIAQPIVKRYAARAFKALALQGGSTAGGMQFGVGSVAGWDGFEQLTADQRSTTRFNNSWTKSTWGRSGELIADSMPGPGSQLHIGFTMSRTHRFLVSVELIARALLYSPLAVNILFPVMIWAPAVCIAVYKLARSVGLHQWSSL